MVIAGLSSGHKIGLAVVAGIFILFALSSSFLAPRRKPDFPGKNGLSVFVIASLVLFAAMISAVELFGAESEAKGAEAASTTHVAAPQATIQATETEFRIALSTTSEPKPGLYVFVVKNAGKIPHDLAVQGPKVSGPAKTALIPAGGSAKLTVSLGAGSYTLYCTVPGHKAAGMSAKLTIG